MQHQRARWSRATATRPPRNACRPARSAIRGRRASAASVTGSPADSLDDTTTTTTSRGTSTSSSTPAPAAATLESSVDEAAAADTEAALSALGVARVAAGDLFDERHVAAVDPLLAAYFPLGVCLASLRLAAWLAGIALDAPWFRNPAVVRAYLALLGVRVVWRGELPPPGERHVLVSNHVSVGDLLVLFQRPQRYVHLITSALPARVYTTRHLPAILQPANKETLLALAAEQRQQQQQQQQRRRQEAMSEAPLLPSRAGAFGGGGRCQAQHEAPAGAANGAEAAHLGQQADEQQQRRHHQQQRHLQRQRGPPGGSQQPPEPEPLPPVHLFPEGGMTNGAGMMRFSRGFMLFADSLPVVPVALRLRPALPQVRSHTLSSSFLANLFWFSFQPWTTIEATALPAVWLEPGEAKAAFVQRVQLAIARELRVWVSDLSIQQKRAMAKRHEQQQGRRRG